MGKKTCKIATLRLGSSIAVESRDSCETIQNNGFAARLQATTFTRFHHAHQKDEDKVVLRQAMSSLTTKRSRGGSPMPIEADASLVALSAILLSHFLLS